jgi:hypothetical protein
MNEIPHCVRDDNVFLDSLDGRSGDSLEIKLSAESSANRRFFHPFHLKLLVIPSVARNPIHQAEFNNYLYEPL